jgi:hypothetical protein
MLPIKTLGPLTPIDSFIQSQCDVPPLRGAHSGVALASGLDQPLADGPVTRHARAVQDSLESLRASGSLTDPAARRIDACPLSGGGAVEVAAALERFSIVQTDPWSSTTTTRLLRAARRDVLSTEFVLRCLAQLKTDKFPHGQYPAAAFAYRVHDALSASVRSISRLLESMADDLSQAGKVLESLRPASDNPACEAFSASVHVFRDGLGALARQAAELDPDYVLPEACQCAFDALAVLAPRSGAGS